MSTSMAEITNKDVSSKTDLLTQAREIFVGSTPLIATLVSIFVTIFLIYLVTDHIMPAIFHTQPLFYRPYYGYYRNTYGRAADARRKRRGAIAAMGPEEATHLTAKITRAIERQ